MERQYNHDRQAFLIKDGEEEVAVVPFPFSDQNQAGNVFSEGNVQNYNFSIYFKKDVPELDFHLVKLKVGAGGGHPIRLGWMIPFATLNTEDHDILSKPYLNEFAFWAYCHLLSMEDIQAELVDTEHFGTLLDEKYPDGCILIIEKGQMPAGITEKHCELSLARNGYFRHPSQYINSKIKLKKAEDMILTAASEILKVDGTYQNAYIEDFLSHHTYDANSFIRFFYLYQIVEVLLDAEMVELLRDFAIKIENNQTTYRTADRALQKNTESERLNRIVDHSGLKKDKYGILDIACNSFLGSVPGKEINNPESIYQVRNHIVHRFRKAIADEVLVRVICDYLELYLYDLLIQYKLPDANYLQ